MHAMIFMCVSTMVPAVLSGAESTLDWPTWRGPNGNGIAPIPPGKTTIDDPTKAKLLWDSEATIFPSYGGPHYVQTGYGGPVVSDGRVYLVYKIGNGPTYNTEGIEETLNDRKVSKIGGILPDGVTLKDIAHMKASVEADDVVICMDAKTGKTLWKTVYAAQGINAPSLYGSRSDKDGQHLVPTIGNGKVFTFGSWGYFYALDAKTGEKLWHIEPSEALKGRLKEMVSKGTARGVTSGQWSYVHSCPTYLDGRVIVRRGSSVVAYSEADGKQLWALKSNQKTGPRVFGGFSSSASPVIWKHNDTNYILAGATLLNPADGKAIWDAKDCHAGMHGTPTINEGYLVYPGSKSSKDASTENTGLNCYRISPGGAEHLWTLPQATLRNYAAIIKDGYVYTLVTAIERAQRKGRQGDYIAVKADTGKLVKIHQHEGLRNYQSAVAIGDYLLSQKYKKKAGGLRKVRTDPGGDHMGFDVFRMGAGKFEYLGVLPFYQAQATSYAIADGRLFCRHMTGLACYELCK